MRRPGNRCPSCGAARTRSWRWRRSISSGWWGRPAGRPETLWGGQQQRVAICRALLQEPEIVLADEPVASLDPENTRIVMEALRRINRHYGATVMCNLHSVELARA